MSDNEIPEELITRYASYCIEQLDSGRESATIPLIGSDLRTFTRYLSDIENPTFDFAVKMRVDLIKPDRDDLGLVVLTRREAA